MRWLEAARARLRLLLAPRTAELRMDEEIRFHVEMETERLMRAEGLDAPEARRRALVAFGGVEKYREELRTGRGLDWLRGMKLDFKLAVRMLVKYPGLTVVSTVGMAVGIGVGAASFAVIYAIGEPKLPLDDGERVVSIQNWDPTNADQNHGRTHLHDFEVWREELSAVEDLAAYRTVSRNVVTPDGRIEPQRVVEMTASGFRIARVSPILGRYLVEEDESLGAPPVVVIGHDVWQGRFAGDAAIIGRTLQLGSETHTVIGVMPRGFAFPVNNRIWTPFRLDASDFPVGGAPPVEIFGRLAPGVDMAEAEAQLTTIGRRLAAAYPATHATMQPRVMSYPRSFMDAPDLIWALHLAQLFITLILVVIGINVAALVYARTATRVPEIAVRTALGASRARVIMQLFAEALVLSTGAAALGLAGARLTLRQVSAFVSRIGGEQVPFWWRFELSTGSLLYVAGLVVMAALIVGVVPALKVTGRRVHGALQASASGGSALQLGRTWTAIIVAQVALAVAVMPLALRGVSEFLRYSGTDQGVEVAEFLAASVQLDRTARGGDTGAAEAAHAARWVALHRELVRRLEAEPRISRAVSTTAVPGAEPDVRIEVEDPAAEGRVGLSGHDAAGVARVEADFFQVLEIPTLAGRVFHPGSADGGPNEVLVNLGFVERVLEGAPPLGQRVRYAARGEAGEPGPWMEIVGVVADFPAPVGPKAGVPTVYRPLVTAEVASAVLLARVRGGPPAALSGRLRELALGLDPMLRLTEIVPLDAALREQGTPTKIMIAVLALLSLSGLLLSAAGISALMSFTVARRRREIGIRSALGARPRRLLGGVLARALRQITIGVVVGVGLAGVLDRLMGGQMLGPEGPLFLLGAAALMATMGVLAAWSPARRGLRIQPTEALRPE